MKIFCPLDARIWIDDPLLDMEETASVQAVLIKYWQDGGGWPAKFRVYDSWNGRRGTTITAFVKGHPWALQIPPLMRQTEFGP